jgi:Flp pilus assembly protein TadG
MRQLLSKAKPIASQRRRSGAAAVEMALVAPLLAFLFVVTVDFGRIFYYQLTLNNCARNGAIYGSNLRSYQETGWVQPYNNAVNATLMDGAGLNPPLDATMVEVDNGQGSDGNPNVTVSINYPFTMITNFPGINSTFTLRAQSSMRVAP